MKKLFLAICAVFVLALSSCSKDDKLPNIENPTIKELCNLINSNVSSLQTITNAFIDGDSISSIKSIEGRGDVIGYTIDFTYSDITTFYLVNLSYEDNDETKNAPSISVVSVPEEEHFCWTLNGGFILDGNGKRISTQDEVTPQLRVVNNNWEYTVDNGETWSPVSSDVTVKEDNMFSNVGTTDLDFVIITLPNGTNFTFFRDPEFTITFDQEDLVQVRPYQEVAIDYLIEGEIDNLMVTVAYSGDIENATIEDPHAVDGSIIVRVGPTISENDKVTVVATTSQGRLIKTLTFEEEVISVTNGTTYEIPAEGQILNITFETNADFSLAIPEDVQSWISMTESRAMREETVSLTIAPNDGGERTARINVVDKLGAFFIEIQITQKGKSGVVEDPATAPLEPVGDLPENWREAFPDLPFQNYIASYYADKEGNFTQEMANEITAIEVGMMTDISSLQGLKYLPNLTTLNCQGNKLQSLDLRYNTKLKRVDCSGNQLTMLNITGCNDLVSLDLSGNQLTSFDISDRKNLETLVCYDNQLTSLNVTGCTSLYELQCYNNKLTELNLDGCTTMGMLDCSYNQLVTLDISKTNIGKVEGDDEGLIQLKCFMGTLKDLIVRKDAVIYGVTVDRDSKYIWGNTTVKEAE